MAVRYEGGAAVRVVNQVLLLAIACLVLVAVNTARTLESAESGVVDSPFQWDHETPVPSSTPVFRSPVDPSPLGGTVEETTGPAADGSTVGGSPPYDPTAGTQAVAGPTTSPIEATGAATSDERAAARGSVALTEISYPWRERLPGWEIRFVGADEGAYGYTLTKEHRIEIYVRAAESDHLLAHVVAHEIGHAVDVMLNDGDDRDRWQAARGIEDAPWWPDNRAADFATGAGDFAESFAVWQVGPEEFRSQLGDPPTVAQQSLLAELASE